MITINQWFIKNTNRPLNIFLLVAFFIGVILVIKEFRDTKNNQIRTAHEISEILSLSIPDHERRTIEVVLNIAKLKLNAYAIAVCENKKTLSSINSDFDFCANDDDMFFMRTLKEKITGYEDFYLKLKAPIFNSGSIFILIIFLVFIAIFIRLITSYIVFQFKKDILLPLERSINSSEQVQIVEIQKLMEESRKAQESKKKEEIFEAILFNNRKIAHNIKSPLTVLTMMGSVIGDEIKDEKKIRIYNGALNAISDITDDLHTSESTILGFKLESLNQNEDYMDVLNLLKEITEEKKNEYVMKNNIEINFYNNISNIKNISFNMKKYEFKSILSNLINNAIEAIPDDKPGIINLELALDDKDNYQIIIKDNGMGIDGHNIKNIFSQNHTTKKSGTGFGLFHAKTILNQHNADISFVTEKNKGSEFKIKFKA